MRKLEHNEMTRRKKLRQKKYYQTHKEESRLLKKEWKCKNKDKVSSSGKRYYTKHKESVKAKNTKWHELNKEKHSKLNKDWFLKHPKEYENYRLKRKYGITYKDKANMLQSQNNKCEICRKLFNNTKDMHVDHNHSSGQVRNILCRRCNWLIGHCNENIDTLKSAIKYIEKWNTK